MYFPKQHCESIVPEKPGINRFSASHDIDLFYLIHSFKITSIIYNETFPLIIAPIFTDVMDWPSVLLWGIIDQFIINKKFISCFNFIPPFFQLNIFTLTKTDTRLVTEPTLFHNIPPPINKIFPNLCSIKEVSVTSPSTMQYIIRIRHIHLGITK